MVLDIERWIPRSLRIPSNSDPIRFDQIAVQIFQRFEHWVVLYSCDLGQVETHLCLFSILVPM